jgi:hypothetical protein
MDQSTKMTFDTDFYRLTIPVGHLAGRPIAVTLATDPVGDNNSDELWWARPTFVRDTPQQLHIERLKENLWRLSKWTIHG